MPYPARSTAVFVATVATLAFAQRAPARQVATLDAVRAATSRDDAFLRINANYPGFAGIHLENGRAVISSTAASGKADLAELLSLGGELDLDVGEITTREVEFEFAELSKLRDQLMPALDWRGGAHALDVDERTNRVTVYVRGENERLVVTELMLRQAARFEAVTFVTQSPARATADLRSQFRPVPGGVQIGKENFAVCTNGWSVLHVSRNENGFVTASHCTNIQGGTEGTLYGQPNPGFLWLSRIGIEVLDPFYPTTVPGCPAGRQCRRSDAAFFRFDSGATGQRGRVANPGSRCALPSINCALGPTTTPMTVTGTAGFPFAGQPVDKVGRTTGWTFGAVNATCIHVNLFSASGVDTGKTFLCQDAVSAGVSPGDSGGPVFIRNGLLNFDIQVMGVMWGIFSASNFIFSHWTNVQDELGSLNYLP